MPWSPVGSGTTRSLKPKLTRGAGCDKYRTMTEREADVPRNDDTVTVNLAVVPLGIVFGGTIKDADDTGVNRGCVRLIPKSVGVASSAEATLHVNVNR